MPGSRKCWCGRRVVEDDNESAGPSVYDDPAYRMFTVNSDDDEEEEFDD
jgi:hypothetical protein